MNTELERKVNTIPVKAQEAVVRDQETLTAANELLLGIKTLQKEVGESWDRVIAKAHEAHKEALAGKRKYESPLALAEKLIKDKISAYLLEEKRKREEAAAKAYRAEQERIRLEANALPAAQAAEDRGDREGAERILEDAAAKEQAITKAVPIIPRRPETTGIRTQETWTFRVTDPNLIPREYLTIDMVKIGKIVRELKSNTRIPGVQAYAVQGIAARPS